MNVTLMYQDSRPLLAEPVPLARPRPGKL